MDGPMTESIVQRIRLVHGWLLQTTEELDEEELCRSLGANSPPIGWHLWHMARWADRLQASLPADLVSNSFASYPSQEVWKREELAARWSLDPKTLGTFEEGSGMSLDAASILPGKIGRRALLDYGRRVFNLADTAASALRPEQLAQARPGIMDYEVIDGRLRRVPGKSTTIFADLIFHISHANRHLGMIEALRGVLGRKGTATA